MEKAQHEQDKKDHSNTLNVLEKLKQQNPVNFLKHKKAFELVLPFLCFAFKLFKICLFLKFFFWEVMKSYLNVIV